MTLTSFENSPAARIPHPLAVGGAARGIVRPWIIGIGAALLLGLFDRFITQATVNAGIDLVVNLLAAAGLIFGARYSVLALRRGETPAHRVGLRGLVYGAGFIGPLLATQALTWASRDIDGSTWTLFSPVLGVILVAAALLLGRRLR